MSWWDEKEEARKYKVVVNDEKQYWLWFYETRSLVGGRDMGKRGAKTQCLDYIKTVWLDMRPKSLKMGY